MVVGCESPKPSPSLEGQASVDKTEPEPPFALPAAREVPLQRVGEWVDRARAKLPANEVSKIDAWLREAVRMPVEVRGESRKTLSDTTPLTCGYQEKMSCDFSGTLSEKAKHFVASTLLCMDKDDAILQRSDWKIEPNTPRGKVVKLPVDDGLLRQCWEKGGVSLRLEVVGMPCVVPFPRQVRCAGEYNTCLHRCKGEEPCEQTCDGNRRSCLAVCK